MRIGFYFQGAVDEGEVGVDVKEHFLHEFGLLLHDDFLHLLVLEQLKEGLKVGSVNGVLNGVVLDALLHLADDFVGILDPEALADGAKQGTAFENLFFDLGFDVKQPLFF